MIADGYRIFVNGCVVASFVEVIVAVITEEKSGAGNGTNCSQLNIVIRLVEAMYLFEGMWLFRFCFKEKFFAEPSAFESEIHPSHKTSFCTLCISRLHRAITPDTAMGS